MLAVAAEADAAGPFVGANIDLARLPAKDRVAEVTRLVESGASGVRLVLDWNRVEPRPGRFTWKADDAAVHAARAQKLEVVLVLEPCAAWAVNPAWQVPPSERAHSLPRSLALWQRYVKEAAKHFRGRVRYWQVREQPNVRNFRGARSEFLKLVASASRVLRAADPKAVLVVPEAGVFDIGEVDWTCSSKFGSSCDVFGLYLPGGAGDQSQTALAWAVLAQEIPYLWAGDSRSWVLGADGTMAADLWIEHYLLAWAARAGRFYLPAEVINRSWLAPLGDLRYCGFLRLGPDVWALVFEDKTGPVVAAWARSQMELPAPDLGPLLDPKLVAQSGQLGGAPGSAVTGEGEALRLLLGTYPILVRGLDVTKLMHPGSPTRADVLAARPGPDPSSSQVVYVDYGDEGCPESGLYNRSLRGRIGGRVEEEMHNGRRCLRTSIGASDSQPGDAISDNPWIYFDVDDRWLYFARGKTPVAITVECEGSYLGEQKLGFNILYDSTTGYRFSPWQWVEAGPGWHTYRLRLDDVSFANRSGYDFRINVKGSKQDLWVAAVRVEKLARHSLGEGGLPSSPETGGGASAPLQPSSGAPAKAPAGG